jgi:hypothetical protein
MAARSETSWVGPVARIGFAARGIVYVLLGVLAAQYAAGLGGRVTDAEGAVRTIGRAPFGAVLLGVVALGLLAYAAWRFLQAALDLDDKGADAKGWAVRAGYAASGAVHLGLAFTAGALAVGLGRRSDGDEVRRWTARALDAPLGPWIVGLAGLAVIGAAAFQLRQAWNADFEKRLQVREMGPGERKWARGVGRAGLAARGATFGLMGWFLVRAALETDAGEAGGLGAVLRSLRTYEHGQPLLFAVGAGLAAYGLLSLVNARYRRIAT